MAVSYLAESHGGASPAGDPQGDFGDTLDLAVPGVAAAGDALIASVYYDPTTGGTPTFPAGWDVVQNLYHDMVGGGNDYRLVVLARRVGASEPSVHTITWPSGDAWRTYTLVALRGGSSAGPVVADSATGDSNPGGDADNPTTAGPVDVAPGGALVFCQGTYSWPTQVPNDGLVPRGDWGNSHIATQDAVAGGGVTKTGAYGSGTEWTAVLVAVDPAVAPTTAQVEVVGAFKHAPTSGTAATVSVTGVEAGDALVAWIVSQVPADNPAAASDVDGAFAKVTSIASGGGEAGGDFLLLTAAHGGTHVVTTNGGTALQTLFVAVLRASAPGRWLLQGAIGAELDGGGGTLAVPDVAVGAGGVILHGYVSASGTSPYDVTPETGWSLPAALEETDGSSKMAGGLLYREFATAGTYGADHAVNVTDGWSTVPIAVELGPPPEGPYSLFAETHIPAIDFDNGDPIELGVKLRSALPGEVTAVRFYKRHAEDVGPYTVSIWSLAGDLLATATFTPTVVPFENAWLEAQLDAPLALAADTPYVVSRLCPDGHLPVSNTITGGIMFDGQGWTRGPLAAYATGDPEGPNGVFHSPGAGFPTSTFGGSNYFVDVVFWPDLPEGDLGAETLEAAETARPVALAAAPVSAPTVAGVLEAAPVAVGARLFDGTSDGATHADSAVLDLVGDLTVECWIRDDHTDYNHGETSILSHGGSGDQWGWWFDVRFRDFRLGVRNDYAESVLGVHLDGTGFSADDYPDLAYPPCLPGTWHHVAATYRHSDRRAEFFVDGVRWKTRTLLYPIQHASITGPLAVGVHPHGDGAFWLGGLTEVRLWAAVRTPAEIEAYYRVRADGDEAGLVLCYHLDEAGSATTLVDAASGLDLTATTATALAAPDVPTLYSPEGTPPPLVSYPDPAYTLFGPSEGPPGAFTTDTVEVEVGMQFRSTVPGTVTAIRYYTDATDVLDPGADPCSEVRLYSRTGTLLASAPIDPDALGAAGWYQTELPTPVPITEYTTYVVAHFSQGGNYAGTVDYFESAGKTSGPLYAFREGEALGSGQTGHNGRFHYAPAGGFPDSGFNEANYWVDVVFDPAPVALVFGGTGAETLEAQDLARAVAVAAGVAGSSSLLTGGITYTETNRAVAVVATATAPTNLRALGEPGLAVSVLAAVTAPTQRQTVAETARAVPGTATVTLPAQLLAKGEPLRPVPLTATATAPTDRVVRVEVSLPVPVAATATPIAPALLLEPARAVGLTATVTATGLPGGTEARTLTATATATGTESVRRVEPAGAVAVVAAVTATGVAVRAELALAAPGVATVAQASAWRWTEPGTLSASATPVAQEAAARAELARGLAATAAVTAADTKVSPLLYNDPNRAVAILATVSGADLPGGAEARSVGITAVVTAPADRQVAAAPAGAAAAGDTAATARVVFVEARTLSAAATVTQTTAPAYGEPAKPVAAAAAVTPTARLVAAAPAALSALAGVVGADRVVLPEPTRSVAVAATVVLVQERRGLPEPWAVAVSGAAAETERAVLAEAGRPVPLTAQVLASDQFSAGGFVYNEGVRSVAVLAALTAPTARLVGRDPGAVDAAGLAAATTRLVGRDPTALALTAAVGAAAARTLSEAVPLPIQAAAGASVLWVGLEVRSLAGTGGVGGGTVLLARSDPAVAVLGSAAGTSAGAFGAAAALAADAGVTCVDVEEEPGNYFELDRAAAVLAAAAGVDELVVTEPLRVEIAAGAVWDDRLRLDAVLGVALTGEVTVVDQPLAFGAVAVGIAATAQAAARLLAVDARLVRARTGVSLPLEPFRETVQRWRLDGAVARRWRAVAGWGQATVRLVVTVELVEAAGGGPDQWSANAPRAEAQGPPGN